MKIFLMSVALIGLALGALAVRLFLVKDGKFSGGSCKNLPSDESDELSCACGNTSKCTSDDQF